MRNNNVDLLNLLIVYDDLDLPQGSIRLRKTGGSAGHRGIQSIIDTLGSADFPRLRIGIGKPPDGMEGSDYVLQVIDPGELVLINEALNKTVEAILLFVDEGLEAAMNNFNQGLLSSD